MPFYCCKHTVPIHILNSFFQQLCCSWFTCSRCSKMQDFHSGSVFTSPAYSIQLANPVTRDSFGTWVTTKPMSIRERSYQLAQKSISYLQLFTSLHHILRLMSWIIYITSPNHLHLHWEKWTEQNNNLSQLLHWGQDDTASHERQKCHYFVGPWLGMCLSALMPASAFTHLWFCAVCRKCAKAKCGISQALLSAHK